MLFMPDRLHVKEPIERVGLDPFHHTGKEIEAFALVLDERIFLPVPTQSDPVAQVIHPQQVIFPVVVDNLEHERLLQETHQFRA